MIYILFPSETELRYSVYIATDLILKVLQHFALSLTEKQNIFRDMVTWHQKVGGLGFMVV